MSLFEDSDYIYRDTFFVFFDPQKRPSAERVQGCIAELGSKYEVANLRSNDEGFESITVKSPHDFSAMDITFVQGEEVTAQIADLLEEFRTMTLVGDDHKKLSKVKGSTARFDVFHFEKLREDEADALDPGGLLIIMEKLSELCDGVALDPQSQTFL